MYRTIAKIFFEEFDAINMQNLSDILPVLYTPPWPSHKVRPIILTVCLASSTYSSSRDVSPEKTASGS